MRYGKVEAGILIQRQLTPEDGFIEIPDSAVCGQLTADGGKTFTNPEPWPLSYIEKRKKEYPSVTDQLDMIYHDQVDGTTKWRDKIASIKQKYPKP